ncbi:hypothetical protein HK105_200250 [Polyrhizophydium stewartii]|uniref:Uncharacterized protein n=1 Tax=Polyrhizophydium stewartii TaxID=2732419 RepID=A0ABR4NKX7_9FUNG
MFDNSTLASLLVVAVSLAFLLVRGSAQPGARQDKLPGGFETQPTAAGDRAGKGKRQKRKKGKPAATAAPGTPSPVDREPLLGGGDVGQGVGAGEASAEPGAVPKASRQKPRKGSKGKLAAESAPAADADRQAVKQDADEAAKRGAGPSPPSVIGDDVEADNTDEADAADDAQDGADEAEEEDTVRLSTQLSADDELSTSDLPTEDGWQVLQVKKKPFKSPAPGSASPSWSSAAGHRPASQSAAASSSGALTKTQRQNQRKAELAKAAKAEADRLQQERLRQHRKAQERAHLDELTLRDRELATQKALERNYGAPAAPSASTASAAQSSGSAKPSKSIWD